jgi:hypothetical protein
MTNTEIVEKKKRGRPKKIKPDPLIESFSKTVIEQAEKELKKLPKAIVLPSEEEIKTPLDVAERIQQIVNPPTQSMDNGYYNAIEVEDEEEEDFTIDFAKGIAYSVDDQVVLLENGETPFLQQATFQNELTNTFIDRIVGATLSNMIRDLDNSYMAIEDTFWKLGKNITSETRDAALKTLDKERNEIKRCYNSLTVNYDLIPEFAKGKIRYDLKKVVDTLIELSL